MFDLIDYWYKTNKKVQNMLFLGVPLIQFVVFRFKYVDDNVLVEIDWLIEIIKKKKYHIFGNSRKMQNRDL